MIRHRFPIVFSATFLLAATFVANAQAQYAPALPGATVGVLGTPPSWSYDPYTSGLGPCTDWSHIDLATCGDLNPPTYGQPTYRPPTHPGVYY